MGSRQDPAPTTFLSGKLIGTACKVTKACLKVKAAAGRVVASGVYFYLLEAKPLDGTTTFNSFKKMLMLKWRQVMAIMNKPQLTQGG